MQWIPGDAGFEAVRDSYLNDTELALLVFDGGELVDGNQGLCANFNVFSFTRNEPLEEALTVSVNAKPSSEIEWYEFTS